MRTIKREVVEPKTIIVYIAEDGTEFKSEEDCLNYEQDKYEKLEKIQKERLGALDNCPLVLNGFDEDNAWYEWYYVRDAFFADKLNDAYGTVFNLDNDFRDYINDWVCVRTCYEYAEISSLKTTITYIENILKHFGYKVFKAQ